MTAISSLLNRAKRLGPAFKQVLAETKEAYKLRNLQSSGFTLSRRQELLLRTNSESVGKLATFFFAQAVPIVGWFPIILALSFPRYILTRPFWTDEQFLAFLQEEYKERCDFAFDLKNHIVKGHFPLDSSLFVQGGSLSSLEALSPTHAKLLAGANGIHGSYVLQTFAPDMLTKRALAAAAKHIVHDDVLLRKEGIADLTREELMLALVNRGFNPNVSGAPVDSSSDDVTQKDRQSLEVWLRMYEQETVSASPATAMATAVTDSESSKRGASGNTAANVNSNVAHTSAKGQSGQLIMPSYSYVLHAAALPELLPKGPLVTNATATRSKRSARTAPSSL